MEKLAKQIILTIPEVEDILFARINKFALDRLVYYATNFFPFHLAVHKEELLNPPRKTSNGRLRKCL